MKTKWGSCNPEAAAVWFNVELAKKHPLCLEYIVVHEMAHLIERTHGERFTNLMTLLLPDWRSRRDHLNGAPLAHEKWWKRLGAQRAACSQPWRRGARYGSRESP